MLSEAGPNIDIRTDVAGYFVYRDGEFETEETSISDYWSEDLVAFALGCSHSFEDALTSAGIGMRHIQNKSTVPMFQTNVDTIPNEVFGGKLVVSMRPIRTEQIDLAVQVSSRFPHSHGAPVHIGNPEALGIGDVSVPDWGEPVSIDADETPVFWACGVTSQVAVRTAKPPVAITHRPGSMLITELEDNSELFVPGLE
jgi:uncharacterized protein YcsI (UPF0317 family)